MTLFHFVNCCLLSFGPHFVYYKATPLCVDMCGQKLAWLNYAVALQIGLLVLIEAIRSAFSRSVQVRVRNMGG